MIKYVLFNLSIDGKPTQFIEQRFNVKIQNIVDAPCTVLPGVNPFKNISVYPASKVVEGVNDTFNPSAIFNAMLDFLLIFFEGDGITYN